MYQNYIYIESLIHLLGIQWIKGLVSKEIVVGSPGRGVLQLSWQNQII